jgi:hypothetical protein
MHARDLTAALRTKLFLENKVDSPSTHENVNPSIVADEEPEYKSEIGWAVSQVSKSP